MSHAMLCLYMLSAATVFCFAAQAAEPSPQDKKFVADAASGNMTEVRIGQYVSDNTTNEDVRKYAETLVGDHSKSNDELKTLASQKSIELPHALHAQDKARLERLEKLTGPELDKAFVADMVEDHQHDIKDFEKEIADGANVDVKGFAEKTLPTLKEHLKMAETLAKKV